MHQPKGGTKKATEKESGSELVNTYGVLPEIPWEMVVAYVRAIGHNQV